MLGRRGPLSKLVGGGVGLAKEYQADRKSRKEASASHDQHDEDSGPVHEHKDDESSSEEESLDEAWVQDLDEAQTSILGSATTPVVHDEPHSTDTFLADFLHHHPPPPYTPQQPTGPLSKPVILPQRRPESHTRGFVHAYAPILQDASIDQTTWFEFLSGLDASINGNGWFHAVNVAAWVAGKVRFAVEGFSWIARLVFTAIHVSVEGGRRTYIHAKQNTYLDVMNEKFFKPRGLYCLLIKYKPSSKDLVEDVDMQKHVTEVVAKRDDEDRSKWRNLTSSASDKITHEDLLPEFAPLVFPALDTLSPPQQQNALKSFGLFMQDYYDRRAQAQFDGANPTSKLAGLTPRKEFASAYSDPNSQVSQGGLVSTLSGGKFNPRGPLGRLQDKRGSRKSAVGLRGDLPVGKEGRKQRRSKRPMQMLLKSDTLYLMVVNMPTQEEMDGIKAAMDRSKEEE